MTKLKRKTETFVPIHNLSGYGATIIIDYIIMRHDNDTNTE